MNDTNKISVDAVITWVDSSDSVWQNKINKHLENRIDWSDKKSSTRYNSIDEIETAIASIIKFAPFVKNIFLVTDNQSPKGFNMLKAKGENVGINLELIDHKIIFNSFENYLPTFNSCSIFCERILAPVSL
mgnify:CR=1 FL=1